MAAAPHRYLAELTGMYSTGSYYSRSNAPNRALPVYPESRLFLNYQFVAATVDPACFGLT